ncbi:MAG: hypothetical protein ACI4JZ_07790 [Oscillospiraceae bacterium]
MGEIILASVLGLASIAAFVFSVRSFKEKDFFSTTRSSTPRRRSTKS